jgi:hypothetical protein
VAIVSTVVAFAIWLISRVINVDTEITEELGAKVVEIANKRVPRPFRFLFLAPPAGQLGTHPGRRVGHVPAQLSPLILEGESDARSSNFHALAGAVP